MASRTEKVHMLPRAGASSGHEIRTRLDEVFLGMHVFTPCFKPRLAEFVGAGHTSVRHARTLAMAYGSDLVSTLGFGAKGASMKVIFCGLAPGSGTAGSVGCTRGQRGKVSAFHVLSLW